MKMLAKKAVPIAITIVCFLLICFTYHYYYATGFAENKRGELPSERRMESESFDDGWGSYSFPLELDRVVDTDLYHFEGNRIELTMGAYRSGVEKGTSEYFSVELHYMVWGVVDVLVGSRTLMRWGHSHVAWDGLEKGDYYFRFVKDADGQTINSQNVQIIGYVINEDTNEEGFGS